MIETTLQDMIIYNNIMMPFKYLNLLSFLHVVLASFEDAARTVGIRGLRERMIVTCH